MTSTKTTVVALCASALLVTACVGEAAPVIVNGNFDTSVPTNGTGGGWTAAGNDLAGGHRTAPSDGVSFTNFFILNAGGELASDPEISQLITGFEAGHKYRISGNYEHAHDAFGSPVPLSFGVEIVELALLSEFAQPPGESTGTFGIEFTVASAAGLTLRLTAERNGDDSAYGIDNIGITDLGRVPTTGVPEPASVGLFIGGLIALARLRRRLDQRSEP